jgi:hypothetical protein
MPNHQRKVIFVMFACLTLIAPSGCDAVDADPSEHAIDATLPFDVIRAPIAVQVDARAAIDTRRARAVDPSKSTITDDDGRYAPTDELMIGWVRWALGQPFSASPIADPTGELCDVGQDGPVWYLAGTFGGPVERACDIPAGKQLFVPLVNQWCVFPDEYYPSEQAIAAELPSIEAWYQDTYTNVCALTLRLDGVDLIPGHQAMIDELHIQVIEPFDIVLNDDHWAAQWFAGGAMPATAAGFFARLQPLMPGDHVLEIGGDVCGAAPFSTLATYHLHVGG